MTADTMIFLTMVFIAVSLLATSVIVPTFGLENKATRRLRTRIQAVAEGLDAEGISQALLTTAAGLSVAIPGLIAYLYFISRVDRLVISIDSLGQQVVDLISAEAQANRKGGRRAA